MITKKEIITNFALPNMHLKIITKSDLEQESSVKEHMQDFNMMSDIVRQHPHANISAIEEIVKQLSSIKNVISIEITNPTNKNGFVYTISNT